MAKKKKKKKKKGAGAPAQNKDAATPATTPTIPSDGTAADDTTMAKIADPAAGPTADAAVSGTAEAKLGDASPADTAEAARPLVELPAAPVAVDAAEPVAPRAERPEARRHSIDAALKGAEVMARLTAKEAMRGVAKLAAETGVGVQEDHEQRALRRRVSVAAADLGELVSAEMGAR